MILFFKSGGKLKLFTYGVSQEKFYARGYFFLDTSENIIWSSPQFNKCPLYLLYVFFFILRVGQLNAVIIMPDIEH